jgi:hypothetical protein
VYTFCLPGCRVLLKFIQHIQLLPGLNEVVFNTLKLKLDTFQQEDKLCMLCVDEMSIKANMFYIGLDSVIGLDDVGSKKAFKPAVNATVLMVRGLHGNWKQPLAYHFVNSTCPGNMLKGIVVETILHLNAIGLKVCVVVCDLRSNNIQMARLLNVTAEQPFFVYAVRKLLSCLIFHTY